MMRSRSAALAAVVLLAACGGGHAAGSLPATAASSARSATASATITIPAKAGTSAATRALQYVSASTAWITFAVNGGAAQGFDASATSPNCTAVTNGRTCSFTISLGVVTPGTQSVAVKTYTANPVPGPATLLSENTATVTIAGDATNVALPLVLDGVPAAATIAIPAGTMLMQGEAVAVPVTVAVTDPAGNTIIGNAPFDGGGSVALSVQPAAGTLSATPLVGTTTTAATVSLTSPSTTVTFNYASGAVLDAIVSGTLVRPSSTNVAIARQLIPVQIAASNATDTVTSVAATGTRVVRGTDGSVYYLTAAGGVGRVAFAAGTLVPSASACTTSGAIDLAVSSANRAFVLTSTAVASFPAAPFPAGGACGAGASYPLAYAGDSIAATSNGVYALSIGSFVTPGSGSPVYTSSFNATTGANLTSEVQQYYSTSNPIAYGDPAVAQYGVFSSNSYGEDLAGSLFTGAAFPGYITLPSTAGSVEPGTFVFGMDPNSSTVYMLDTSPYLYDGEMVSPIVLNAATGAQLGPGLPAGVLEIGQPVVAADGRIFVASGAAIDEYVSATNSFITHAVTESGGSALIGGAVLGADGRLWCIDGENGHILAFPGTGASL